MSGGQSDALQTNIPAQLTSFVGRRSELEELTSLLHGSRSVTLAGPGGCGKTRLAIELASMRSPELGRVWFVDLAPVADAPGMARALLEAIGAAPAEPGEPLDRIRARIGEAPALLILDNCEHLVEECAVLAEAILVGCAATTIVATSREPLGFQGETTYRVPSLALPPEGADEVTGYDAIALFVDRAAKAKPGFRFERESGALVSQICRRLDGIPLAIELAAARVRVLGLDQIHEGLKDRFRLLTGGARTAVPRHQTLQASVDWSYALLLEAERELLDRLSVFGASFTVDAAEFVGSGEALESHHVFDLLVQLAEKSLVSSVEGPDGARFVLLESVRQYAATRLAERGDAEQVRRRHYDHYLQASRFAGTDNEKRSRMQAEVDNLRQALQWAREQDDPTLLLRLASRLAGFWATGPALAEGTQWLSTALQRAPDADLALRARATARLVQLLSFGGAHHTTLGGMASEAINLMRELGNPRDLAWTLIQVGRALSTLEHTDPLPYYEEAAQLAAEARDEPARALALYFMAQVTMHRDPTEGRALALQSMEVARGCGFGHVERLGAFGVVMAGLFSGELAALVEPLAASVAELRGSGDELFLANALMFSAIVSEGLGDSAHADACVRDLERLAAGGLVIYRASVHQARGMVMSLRGQWGEAVGDFSRFIETRRGEMGQSPGLAWRAIAFALGGDLAAARIDAVNARIDAVKAAEIWTPTAGEEPFGPFRLATALVAVRSEEAGAVDLALSAFAAVWERSGVRIAFARLGSLQTLAAAFAGHGATEEAARILGFAKAEASRVGVTIEAQPWLTALALGTPEQLRAVLGDTRIAELYEEGASMDEAELVAYVQRGRGGRGRPVAGWGSLTPTERQVVDLVTEGLTNKDIAGKLFMSVPTVKSHLTHVYAKLGTTSRAALTAEAVRRA